MLQFFPLDVRKLIEVGQIYEDIGPSRAAMRVKAMSKMTLMSTTILRTYISVKEET